LRPFLKKMSQSSQDDKRFEDVLYLRKHYQEAHNSWKHNWDHQQNEH
jgi:hypothetical protein